jgi:tetratricopeptide (TPR) repeat protein
MDGLSWGVAMRTCLSRARRACVRTQVILLALLVFHGPASAQPQRDQTVDGVSRAERQRIDDQVYGQLTKAWSAFYAGKYEDAASLAEPLLQFTDGRYRWVPLEAGHLQARCLWAHGTRDSRDRAQQMWAQLDRATGDAATRTRSRRDVARVLALEARNDPASLSLAIDTLEALVRGERWDHNAIEEVGIDLARLYVKARRFDDAEKTLKYIIAYLGDRTNVTRLEIPPALVKPYVDAAKAALDRLKYERDAGRREFEAAERLRKAARFPEAISAYRSVIRDFGDSDYAFRSGLHIGDCFLGMGQNREAVEHWRRFTSAMPAGPWRGQAYVALIDLHLEEFLDLAEAARCTELAQASMATALADQQAAESWQAAAFDLHLRIGLVGFCQNRGQSAIESFQKARSLTRSRTLSQNLELLIAAARESKSLLPAECAVPAGVTSVRASAETSPQAVLALSLGTIYTLTGQHPSAHAFFDRVAGRPAVPARGNVPAVPARVPMRGISPAQAAFAAYGKGIVLHEERRLEQALEQLLGSLRFADGSWHDETLYRAASIIEARAAAEFGGRSTAPQRRAQGKSDSTRPTVSRQEAAALETERLAALLRARGAALPYWRELLGRYPDTPHREEAYYRCGRLLYDLAKASPLEHSGDLWTEASAMFERLCEDFPASAYAGEAYVRLIDLSLERRFDFPSASRWATAAVAWVGTPQPNPDTHESSARPAWRGGRTGRAAAMERGAVLHALYQRAGVIAYLDGRHVDAVGHFRSSEQYAPRDRRYVAVGQILMGAARIEELAKQKAALTPQEVLAGEPKARLILQLADLYHVLEDYAKSSELCDLVIESGVNATREQRSWALFRRGRNQFSLGPRERDAAAVVADYSAAVRLAPQAPWASRALFLSANLAFNINRDTDAAIVGWRQVLREYPQCGDADRSAYYIGVAYEVARRPREARAAYEDFLRRYPDSPFANLVWSVHLKRVEEMEKPPAR